jgi:hypothetical protein
VKAVLLATAMSAMYLVLVTVGFRMSRPGIRRARFMVRLFWATLAITAALYFATPSDLGFIPGSWLEKNKALEFCFLLFLLSACFFGGILQLYSLADRGFSLRIAIEVDSSPTGSMTVDEVIRSYSAGRGLNWMYQKRVEDMARLNLIHENQNTIGATPAGVKVGERFAKLRRFLRVDG